MLSINPKSIRINFAREKNVTKIVIGKQVRPRWKDLIFGNLVDELARKSGEIDIYIIRGNDEDDQQYEHQVEQRSDVQLVQRAVSAAACFLHPLLGGDRLGFDDIKAHHDTGGEMGRGRTIHALGVGQRLAHGVVPVLVAGA